VRAKIHLGREDYKLLFETRRLQTRIMIRAIGGVSKENAARVLNQLSSLEVLLQLCVICKTKMYSSAMVAIAKISALTRHPSRPTACIRNTLRACYACAQRAHRDQRTPRGRTDDRGQHLPYEPAGLRVCATYLAHRMRSLPALDQLDLLLPSRPRRSLSPGDTRWVMQWQEMRRVEDLFVRESGELFAA
jgi:hypothetical protein